MAQRWFNPDEQICDGNGVPLVGAQLFFYASGTSTKLATYSNSALTIANTNPVVLDSNGRAGSIFLQTLAYKVVLAPANDTDPPQSPIWTQDPVYASDFSTVAQFQYSNGNPNGVLAGTAASTGIPASSAWDPTTNTLYVCTTTGNAANAVWTAANSTASSSNVLPTPQGRLTLQSNTPVIASDQVSATSVYYTPYIGLLVPIYNGTTFVPISIVSQLSLTLVAAHAANKIYDLYVFLLNGTPTLGSGPSWDAGSGGSVTAGSCARGTGAGGAALSILSGIQTNAVSMTMTYGATGQTTTVAANKGTYVGSMFMDGTNGQVSSYVSAGQNRKLGLWNYYSRVPVTLQLQDSTATWSYTAGSWRQSNNSTSNTATIFSGVAEETAIINFTQRLSYSNSNTAAGGGQIGIGFNNITGASGQIGYTEQILAGAAISATTDATIQANYISPPTLGQNNVNAIEFAITTDGANFKGAAYMLLTATWRG